MGRATRLHQAARPQHAARARAPATAAPSPAATAAPSPLIPLQRSIGNQAVGRLVRAKLKAGGPPDPGITSEPAPGSAPAIVHEVLRSPGQPIDPATRVQMEARFGHDLRHVRVHVDGAAVSAAARCNARAFTLGHDIHFGNSYEPSSPAGEALLAHELTHVVQADAAVSKPAQPSSSIEALEREARQVTAAFYGYGTLSSVRGVARDLTAPLRQSPGDNPAGPTFGNLSGRQPAEGRIELKQIGGKWYEIRPGLRGRVLATHRYHFAVQDGRIWASRYGHVEAARGQRVTFAGDLHFTGDGNLIKWDNGSGSFRPAAHFATQAGLPFDKFEPTPPRPKKTVQMAVFQPKPGEVLVPAGARGGGPGQGSAPRGGPAVAGGGGGSQGVPPTTVAPAPPAPAAVQGGQGGMKSPAVSPRDRAAELARAEREARRLVLTTRAVGFGLGAWQVVSTLRDVAKSVNMATAILAQGSPFAAQIERAETIESTAKEIAQHYGSFNLIDQRVPEENPSWNSFYDVYQFQLTFLSMEQSFHEALKEIQTARDNIEKQMNSLRDEMAAKVAALTYPMSSAVYAEVVLFADAGGKINTRLQAAAKQYAMAESSIKYHRGMTMALAQRHERRLRELGTTGVFWKIPTDKIQSTPLDRFTFRR
jgi:hypothetical protein